MAKATIVKVLGAYHKLESYKRVLGAWIDNTANSNIKEFLELLYGVFDYMIYFDFDREAEMLLKILPFEVEDGFVKLSKATLQVYPVSFEMPMPIKELYEEKELQNLLSKAYDEKLQKALKRDLVKVLRGKLYGWNSYIKRIWLEVDEIQIDESYVDESIVSELEIKHEESVPVLYAPSEGVVYDVKMKELFGDESRWYAYIGILKDNILNIYKTKPVGIEKDETYKRMKNTLLKTIAG